VAITEGIMERWTKPSADIALVFLVASLLSGLAGCTSMRVITDYDPDADLTQLQTWAWLPVDDAKSGDPRIDNSLVDARVRNAVNTTLTTKGYRKVEVDAADFLVHYRVGLDKKLQVDTYYTGYGGGYRGWYGGVGTETRVREYEEGTLLLDILDPKKQQLVWQGSTSARVSERSTPEDREARISAAVNAILAKFPPPPPTP
jgi:hypothetical protein